MGETIPISALTFLNRSNSEIKLLLEPEGDVVQVPIGTSCEIKADQPTNRQLDCEIEWGANSELTVYLSVAKQVFLDGERVR